VRKQLRGEEMGGGEKREERREEKREESERIYLLTFLLHRTCSKS
jgi:hypothetical protein